MAISEQDHLNLLLFCVNYLYLLGIFYLNLALHAQHVNPFLINAFQ